MNQAEQRRRVAELVEELTERMRMPDLVPEHVFDERVRGWKYERILALFEGGAKGIGGETAFLVFVALEPGDLGRLTSKDYAAVLADQDKLRPVLREAYESASPLPLRELRRLTGRIGLLEAD